MKKFIYIILIAGITSSCGNQSTPGSSESTAPALDSKGAIDEVAGVYSDTLPCADCPGIITELSLVPDTTFVLRERYLNAEGRPARSTTLKGVYSFTDDMKQVKLTSTEDGGNPRIYNIQKDALVASNGAAQGDLSLELQEKVVGKAGAEYVHYRLKPFTKYPTQVYSHITGNDIVINKPYLDVAPEAEKAIIAYYTQRFNAGCAENVCALHTAMGMDESQLKALFTKWMPDVKQLSADESRDARNENNLAMLFFIRNENKFTVNYNFMSNDRSMSNGSDDFEISNNAVKLVRQGNVSQISKPTAVPAEKKLPAQPSAGREQRKRN